MAYRHSSIKGAASFRRLLKQLPDSANAELIKFLDGAGPVLVAKMKSEIPVLSTPRPDRTAGALRDSISYKVTPKTLNLKVGTLNAKLGRSSLFYGHILDVGRKGGNVKVTRGIKNYPKGINVRAFAGLHILSKVKATYRIENLPGYRSLMDQILLDAARGAGND